MTASVKTGTTQSEHKVSITSPLLGHSDHPPSQRIRTARGYERIACPLTSAGLALALPLRLSSRQGAMLRVSPHRQAVLLQDDRDQDLIGPGARHGSLVYRLSKDHRPIADGQGAQQLGKPADGRRPQ